MGILIYFLIGLAFAVTLLVFYTAKESGKRWSFAEDILETLSIKDTGDLGACAFAFFVLWPLILMMGLVFVSVGAICVGMETLADWFVKQMKKLFK